MSKNPYEVGTREHQAWRDGFAIQKMRMMLEDCAELLDNYAASAQPTGCDHPIPNKAMSLQMEIRSCLESLK